MPPSEMKTGATGDSIVILENNQKYLAEKEEEWRTIFSIGY